MFDRRALCVVALILSGCISVGPESEARFRFGGAFTGQATSSQIEDFGHRMRAHGGDVEVMESYPAQFAVSGFGSTACAAAQREAKGLSYVASATECMPVRTASDPEAPTESAQS